MPIPIALVEDNARLRRRFVDRLQYFEEIQLVFAAVSGEDFFEQLATADVHPEVVLMDIRMPGMSGIEATQRLGAAHPGIDVMMLTVFEDEENVFQSIRAGACGYLLKETSARDLVDAVIELRAGGAPMTPIVARKMLSFVRADEAPTTGAGTRDSRSGEQDAAGESERPDAGFALTGREIETLELLVEDLTDHEIGDRLHISPHTVRSHIKNIYKKLHVHSRASAVRVTLENRLLDRSSGSR